MKCLVHCNFFYIDLLSKVSYASMKSPEGLFVMGRSVYGVFGVNDLKMNRIEFRKFHSKISINIHMTSVRIQYDQTIKCGEK